MHYHPQIDDELARQHQAELRRDGAQPTVPGAPGSLRSSLRFAAVALVSAALALAAGVALAHASNLPIDGTSEPFCPKPTRPVVSVVGATSVTLASAANPHGLDTRAQFVLGGAATHFLHLGAGPRTVVWQMTVATVQPGRRYTIVARTLARGCRSEAATVFTMPVADTPAAIIPLTTDADIPDPVSS